MSGGLIPKFPGQHPEVEHTSVRLPGDETQVGCVWCLQENIDAPASSGIIYYWGGTSMCARHMKSTLETQGK